MVVRWHRTGFRIQVVLELQVEERVAAGSAADACRNMKAGDPDGIGKPMRCTEDSWRAHEAGIRCVREDRVLGLTPKLTCQVS